MLIQSPTLELRILRTLTASNKKQLAKLIKVIKLESFATNIGKEIYQRVMTLANKRGIIITWDELLVDPAISEATRKRLVKYKKKPIRDPERLDRSIGTLQKYTKLRAIYNATEYMINQVQADKVEDVDHIIQEGIAKLNSTGNSGASAEFVDVGVSDIKARKTIRRLLKDNSQSYIPTGLKEFDDRNGGIPRGTFFVIQTNSGGGKSVLANQFVRNAAKSGYRACLIPLEMNKEENLRRHVAAETNTPMGKIIIPKKLNLPEYKHVVKDYLRYNRQIRKAGCLMRIWVPPEDMSMEEILFALQPYHFDEILIDYIGLLAGTDGDDQWRKLGAAGRFAKRYADRNDCCVGVCAQLTDDNKVKYSRAINEHSGLSFSWQYNSKTKESKIVQVELPKSRNQDSRPFYLEEQFEFMRFGEIDANQAKTIEAEQKTNSNVESSGKSDKTKKIKQDKQAEKQKQIDRQIVSESDFTG